MNKGIDNIDNTENKEKKKKRRKRLARILLLILVAAFLTVGPYVYDAVRNDPNILLKKVSRVLMEDSPVSVEYRQNSGRASLFFSNRIPLFAFTPEESAAYTFSVSDIVSEKNAYLSLQVSDSHFDNYMSADNLDDQGDSFEDTVFLNEGSTCYVLIEPFSDSDIKTYSGSFTLSVSKAPEDAETGPITVTETDTAVVKVKEDSQSAVLFVPAESGFFRFESRVISRDRTASSAISSVKATDNTEIKRSEGICYLEGGKEYYVWVSAHEMSKPEVEVEVSCSRIETFRTDQPGEYRITGDMIIEFTAQETENLLVHSVSDGDVRCFVYDSMGFPLNYDDDSGGELSGNDKDFSLVIQAQKKNMYLIYTGGRFDECSIVITKYPADNPQEDTQEEIMGDIEDTQEDTQEVTEDESTSYNH